MSKRCHGELFYHLVWGTKYRKKVITPKVAYFLREYFQKKVSMLNAELLGFDHGEDHVHLCIRTRPEIYLIKLVNELKGGSAFYINEQLCRGMLRWQHGYGVFTVSPELVTKILKYISTQKKHHGLIK